VEATLQGQAAAFGGFHSGDGCSRSNCGGGRNAFAISYDAKLMSCVTNPGIALPLEEMSLEEGWQMLRQRMAGLELPRQCVRCPYQRICNACPATLYNENGRYDCLCEYTCQVIREHYRARKAVCGEE